jgi:predicted TIM-barrel fold metal-dependent hydrolase
MSPTHAIVDCEHHVVVDALDDLVAHLPGSWGKRLRMGEFAMPRTGPHPGVELEFRNVPDGASDPATAAAALDPAVSHALLIASQPLVSSGWLGHKMAAVFCGAVNDHVIARWLPADPRFHFAVAVAAHDGELAAEEIRRVGTHPAAAAVAFSPVDVNLGRRHYHPIYAAAAELGLPVIVHPGGFEGNVVGPAELGGVGPRTPEDMYCLLPQVAMSGISSLIFDGVFGRFPDLRVLFAGFGVSWAPPLLWRMDAEWRGLRIEVPWVTQPPSQIAAEHIRLVADQAVEHTEPGTWALAAMLDERMLVWGSDAPFAGAAPGAPLASVPESLRERLASVNALDTFPRLQTASAVGV